MRILQLLKRAAGAARVQDLAADAAQRTANEIAAELFGSGYGRLQVLQVLQVMAWARTSAFMLMWSATHHRS